MRTRPASAREAKQPCLLQLDNHSLKYLGPECFSNTFSYDAIFEPQATQGQVFSSLEGIVLSVLQGFNGTICAYGQTGMHRPQACRLHASAHRGARWKPSAVKITGRDGRDNKLYNRCTPAESFYEKQELMSLQYHIRVALQGVGRLIHFLAASILHLRGALCPEPWPQYLLESHLARTDANSQSPCL